MRKVILKSLCLTNWRGERQRTTEFNEVETTISGDNGLGKSRHFDAFIWLLFGKDSQDRKDFNIKCIVDGRTLDKVDCEVSGVLDVDGEIIHLRRAYVEDWVKPHGQVDLVFKGNHTETYWNDVPVNVTEYQKRINDIIDGTVFKMVTNPFFFANMKWQDQREQLFQLAGTITDAEIAQSNADFAALLDRISGKSFSDFKREISARKTRLKNDLSQIQPRIDQTAKLMPENADFAALEKELADISMKISNIETEIGDKTAAIRNQYEAVQQKQAQINALKLRRQSVLFDEQHKAREAAFLANADKRGMENDIKATENEIAEIEMGIHLSESKVNVMGNQLEKMNTDIIAMRETWSKVNDEEYDTGSNPDKVICPLYNIVCDNPKAAENLKANQESARVNFNADKAKRLDAIKQNGIGLGKFIAELEKDIANAKKALENSRNELKSKRNILISLKEQITHLPIVEESDVKPEDIVEYVQLSGQINAIESELEDGTDVIDTTDLQDRKKYLQQMRDEVKENLAKRDLIDSYTKEIADLEAKGRNLSQQIADIEREEYIIQSFTKAKVDECERRINGLFKMVQFQLFDYNITDTKKENPIEVCIPLVNGVPFTVANTAGKVNAGLDIINALCGFYGVCAPIFIDGRESVNNIIHTQCQIINLVVSRDKTLLIK